jgi:hypothetical protein
MVAYPRLEPVEDWVEKNRRLLRQRMEREATGISWKDRWLDFWESLLIPAPAQRLAIAVVLLIVGIVIGRVSYSGEATQNRMAKEALAALNTLGPVTNFQVSSETKPSGQVEIRFRTVKNISLKGSLKDPAIQYALVHALVNDPRINIRLKSIGLLESSIENDSVQEALLHAVEHDRNPGIRLKAMRLLTSLPVNEAIKKILVSALFKDPNSGVCTEAVDALTQIEDEDILAILKRRAQDDEYTRAAISRWM